MWVVMSDSSGRSSDSGFQIVLLGDPVGHSVSPSMHNAAFRALGLGGCYSLRRVDKEGLPAAFGDLRLPSVAGANVTIPHKESALGLVDTASESASAIGAVNTVIRHGTQLHGDNTDAVGLLAGLEKSLGVVPYGLRIVLLGAGGAARAAAYALLSGGPASLAIYNRNAARAVALSVAMRDRFGGRVRALSESETLQEAADADLIVNSTSAGMDGVSVPLPGITVRSGAALYDMVYVPSPTPLMRLLRAQGASVADGLDMLVCQAAAAFELWTGREPPIAAMKEAALAELRRRGER